MSDNEAIDPRMIYDRTDKGAEADKGQRWIIAMPFVHAMPCCRKKLKNAGGKKFCDE